MVLYCCQHPALIVRAIVHKLKYYVDESAKIIFISDGKLSDHFMNTEKYFPNIPDVEYFVFGQELMQQFRLVKGEQQLFDFTETVCSKFMVDHEIDYQNAPTFMLWDWLAPFALFYYMHQVSYSVISLFSHNLIHPTGSSREQHALTNEKYHYCDYKCEYIKKIYLPSDKRMPDDNTVPIQSFTLIQELDILQPTLKEILANAYKLDENLINTKNINLVLLLNSQEYFGISLNRYILRDYFWCNNIEDIMEYYFKISFDYYLKGRTFCIKMHPHFTKSLSERFSEFAEFIDSAIPFEVLVLRKERMKALEFFVLQQSTSIDFAKYIGANFIMLGETSADFFRIVHFIFATFQLIKPKLGASAKIYTYGILMDQLRYFRDYAFKDFADVIFEQLTRENVGDAKIIIADKADSEFREIIKNMPEDSSIIVNGNETVEDFQRQTMIYFLTDISSNEPKTLKSFSFSVLSKSAAVVANAATFTTSWILKHAKMRVVVYPDYNVSGLFVDSQSIIDIENTRLRANANYFKYLQMYYAAESTGYTLYDYFKERGLLSGKHKVAFFAVDEFGVIVYQIAERLGLTFSVLLSDVNRTVKFASHQNLTEELSLRSINDVPKSEYTNVFMAVTWNGEWINLVKSKCPKLFLFDAVALAMYVRVFFINKITTLRDKNPGVKVGIFFTPSINQVSGEHSRLEDLLSKPKAVYNYSALDNETLEAVKTLAFRKNGWDDEYINDILRASQPRLSVDDNGIWNFNELHSKYSDFVAGRRVVTDIPNDYNNTIYMFGDSIVSGKYASNDQTVSSHLQRMINDNNLLYCVMNCSNTHSSYYDRIFPLADTFEYHFGDILLFCMRVDWLTEQYIKNNTKNLLNNVLGIYTTPVFSHPHNYGEVFADFNHFNGKGYGLIAQKIFDDISAAGFFDLHEDAQP
jgi:hypothetical protein